MGSVHDDRFGNVDFMVRMSRMEDYDWAESDGRRWRGRRAGRAHWKGWVIIAYLPREEAVGGSGLIILTCRRIALVLYIPTW